MVIFSGQLLEGVPIANPRVCATPYFDVYFAGHARRRVRDGSDSPSTSAVQRSPRSVRCPAVRVPELMISPALNGSVGNRRTMAAPGSARHRAGLRRLFLPE